jgi:hypothetical protein
MSKKRWRTIAILSKLDLLPCCELSKVKERFIMKTELKRFSIGDLCFDTEAFPPLLM